MVERQECRKAERQKDKWLKRRTEKDARLLDLRGDAHGGSGLALDALGCCGAVVNHDGLHPQAVLVEVVGML